MLNTHISEIENKTAKNLFDADLVQDAYHNFIGLSAALLCKEGEFEATYIGSNQTSTLWELSDNETITVWYRDIMD